MSRHADEATLREVARAVVEENYPEQAATFDVKADTYVAAGRRIVGGGDLAGGFDGVLAASVVHIVLLLTDKVLDRGFDVAGGVLSGWLIARWRRLSGRKRPEPGSLHAELVALAQEHGMDERQADRLARGVLHAVSAHVGKQLAVPDEDSTPSA